MPFKICSLHKIIISSNSFYISFFFSSPLPFSQQSGARGQEPITHRILLVICCCCCHRVQRSFVWINELLTLKNVYTCRLARLISPMGSLWIYCKGFLCFLPDPDRLCCSPFWKSITASYILVGAQQVVRRVTEDRRPKGDRSAKWRVKKRIREDTCTTWLSSLWTASLGDGSEWDRKRKSSRPLLIRESKHQLRREF